MAENKFEWTDETLIQWAEFFKSKPRLRLSESDELLKIFKASKTPPKEYEILSFVYRQGEVDTEYKKNSSNKFKVDDGIFAFSEDEMMKYQNVAIKLVQRLSDGEIFSIGDVIEFGNHGDLGNAKIERFEVDYFDNTKISAYNGAYGLGSNRWEKAKPILFTTEDGVGIYLGDTYWTVSPLQWLIAKHDTKDGMNLTHYHADKTFSTKEKAEEYRLSNMPLLSLNDLLSVWEVGNKYVAADKNELKESRLYKKFEELAKQKLSK